MPSSCTSASSRAAAASSRSRRISSTASAPASFSSRRCSSVEKKPLPSSGASVAARAARRSSTVPAKRSSTSTEIAAAPAFANCAASFAGSASGRMSPADGERRFTSAIARRPGCASASANLIERENSTSSSRRAAAAPESIAACAYSMPSRRFSACPAAAMPPAALRTTAARWPPSAPFEDVAQRLRIVRRVAAAQLGCVAALDRRAPTGRARTRAPIRSPPRRRGSGPAGESSSMPPAPCTT